MSKDTTNPAVIKHSAAIHIQNKITLLQRKTWNVLLFYAYDHLLSQDRHCISLKKLRDTLDYNSNNEDYLKEVLYVLTTCGVEWNILRKDERLQWGVTTLLASAVIEDGECIYEYSSQLRERLYNPTMYARISLSMQNKFESKHAQALWELCIDYLGAIRKYGETSYIAVEEFKRLMGVENSSYVKEFKILNRAILKPAIEEINKVSDLRVTVDFQRKSRKVIALKFKISRVVTLPEANIEQSDFFPELKDMPVVVKLLEDTGLSMSDAWKIWQDRFDYVDGSKRPKYSEAEPEKAFTDYVREKIDLLRRHQEQGKVKNATGFLLKAIRENWANPDFAEREKKAAEWKAMAAKQEQRKQLEQEKTQLESAYSEACDTVYVAILQDDPDALADLIQTALEANPFLRRYCEGDTPEAQYRESMAVAGAVHTLMKERYPDRFKVINDDYRPQLDELDVQIKALG